MRLIKGIMIVGLFGSMMLGGCNLNKDYSANLKVANETPLASGQEYHDKTAIRDETGTETNNAVAVAMEWARKYAKASSKRDQLLQENRQLEKKQQTFQQQITKLQLELKRAEEELTQANFMLLEMKTELRKWKISVLGFRNEMRQSQKVQLDTLVRILTLIGGEVVENLPTTQPATQTIRNAGNKERASGAY